MTRMASTTDLVVLKPMLTCSMENMMSSNPGLPFTTIPIKERKLDFKRLLRLTDWAQNFRNFTCFKRYAYGFTPFKNEISNRKTIVC